MARACPWVLLAIVTALAAGDAAWVSQRHFDVDWRAYGAAAGLAAAISALGVLYATKRKDDRLSAMLFGTAFLIAFSALASVTNYFLLTVARHRIDGLLAGFDRALHIDWPAMMAWASGHPTVDLVLSAAYGSVLAEMALLIPLLGFFAPITRIYSFCFALTVATVVTVAVWTVFPSFGAVSVYALPPAVVAHMPLAVDPAYAHELVRLLANGPGFITPTDVQGLIGFPSFHAVMALLVAWYAGSLRHVRVPAAMLNAVVLLATPIQGGHHVVDVLGGACVGAVAILTAERLTAFLARARDPASALGSSTGPSAALAYRRAA